MSASGVSAELSAELARYPVATLYEAAGKRGDMEPAIRPITPGARLAGPAFTVRTFPGETLGVLMAIERAPAGSVLVVDAGGSERASVWGGTSALAARARGIAGVVTNGCVRDADEIAAMSFPVFATGVSPRGTLKNHPGWMNETIAVGGVPVSPGDFVAADADGVVVVPAAIARDVSARAAAQREAEEARDARILAGEPLLSVLGIRLPE
jgi:4-hydroxy-4-methyl-2-oxoglutarate aldolase